MSSRAREGLVTRCGGERKKVECCFFGGVSLGNTAGGGNKVLIKSEKQKQHLKLAGEQGSSQGRKERGKLIFRLKGAQRAGEEGKNFSSHGKTKRKAGLV